MMTHRRILAALASLTLGLFAIGPRLAADDLHGDPLPAGALARLGTTRLRHGEMVELTAFLPDGKTLLTLGGDGVIRHWDVATGKLLRQFKTRADDNNNVMMNRGIAFVGGAAMVFSAGMQGGTALSADAKTLAIRGWDNSVHVWDTSAGKELRRIDTSQSDGGGGVSEIGIAPDGKTVATHGYDNSIRLFEVASGKKLRQLGKKPDNNGGPGAVFYGGNTGLTFTPDGKMLVSTAGENANGKQVWHLILHDTATGTELRRITSDEENAMPISPSFTPDGKTLLWTRWDGSIHLADPATGKAIRQIKGANQWGASEFLVTKDGKTLLVRNQQTGLRILDFASGKELRKFDRRTPQENLFWRNGMTGGLAMSVDGKLVALAGEDHTVRLFDLAAGKEREFGGGHRSAVVQVRYGADGKSIYTRGQDGTLRVWDPATGKEQRQIKVPQNVYHFALSPDGKTLLVAQQDNTVHLRDAATDKELRKLAGPKEGVGSVAFSSDGKTAAVYGAADKGVSIWLYDVATGKEQRRIKVPVPTPDANGNFAISTTGVTGITISPDGRLVAATISTSSLGLWETATGKELTPIQAPDQKPIQGAVFTPDSRCLALDLGEDSVRLWEIASGKERRQHGKKPGNSREPLGGMAGGVMWIGGGFVGGAAPMPYTRPAPGAALSPNGRLLAQSRANQTVSVWDLATGQELGQLKGHEGTVETLAFAADGKTLITGSRDTTGLVWDLTKLAATAKPQAGDGNVEASWKELSSDDAGKAYQAMHALTGANSSSVAFLKQHLHAVAAVDAKKLAQLLADLDSDRFDVRKRASTELEKLGEPVIPALRQALEGEPSSEVRKSIETLLAKTNQRAPRGEALRSLRAIEVLELIGTPEAREVLQTMAKGVPEASVTRAAQGSLDRLGR